MAVTAKRDVAACRLAIGDWRLVIVKSEPRSLRCDGFTRRSAQPQIMSAQNHRVPPRPAEFINHSGQPRTRIQPLSGNVQSQFAAKAAVIDVRQLQRHQSQTYTPL